MKTILVLGITFLFVATIITPIVVGFNLELKETVDMSGPMDSPWPMSCHDNLHTGRSWYSTSNIDGTEKWRFVTTRSWVEGGIIIGDDGTIYYGDNGYYLHALNQDGSLKWVYKTNGHISSTPAISEDGTIYIGAWDHYLHAINTDGSFKWKFDANSANIFSSTSIADDGTIYFGTAWSLGDGGKVHAVNPDGTEKWRFQTGYAISSDPAIAEDGTVYIGSMDSYLYALYPNGTLRWRFKTGDEIHGHPSITTDGTIYFGSYDDHLYALNPDGTEKWRVNTGWGTCANPSIDEDGTIYVGTDRLYAVNPDGTLKWSFNLGPDRWIGFSSPALSAEGTIYVGTHIGDGEGGDIIAINPDGTERWSKKLANFRIDSSPCIGEDGTVYIGSSSYKVNERGNRDSIGYIHAFGPVESNEPPNSPSIIGKVKGNVGVELVYGFSSIDPDNNPVSFYVDWGDGAYIDWTGGGLVDDDLEVDEAASGEIVYLSHTYLVGGRSYTIKCKARDVLNEESGWSYLEISIPKNKPTSMLYWFLEQYPPLRTILERVLS